MIYLIFILLLQQWALMQLTKAQHARSFGVFKQELELALANVIQVELSQRGDNSIARRRGDLLQSIGCFLHIRKILREWLWSNALPLMSG